MIGAGCSLATEATAEISHYYNVPQVDSSYLACAASSNLTIAKMQISCASSSDELSDRVRFPYYFQLLPSEVNLARVFYSIIKEYDWRRVALIVQNEYRYRAVSLLDLSPTCTCVYFVLSPFSLSLSLLQTMRVLKELLLGNNVSLSEIYFNIESSISETIFVSLYILDSSTKSM